MSSFLQTKLRNNEKPVMLMGKLGHVHCLWKEDKVAYAKFNGVNWEFLNDLKFVPVPENAVLFPNSMTLDEQQRPYFLYAVSGMMSYSSYDSSGSISSSVSSEFDYVYSLHMAFWSGSTWEVATDIIDDVLFSASLAFYDDDFYVIALSEDNFGSKLIVFVYQGGNFYHLNEVYISDVSRGVLSGDYGISLLIRRVEDSLYCFWNNGDDGTQWIEHVIYYPVTNTFEYHGDKKIELTDNAVPITGFDFSYLGLPVSSSSSDG